MGWGAGTKLWGILKIALLPWPLQIICGSDLPASATGCRHDDYDDEVWTANTSQKLHDEVMSRAAAATAPAAAAAAPLEPY